jgi:hypothetical protein
MVQFLVDCQKRAAAEVGEGLLTVGLAAPVRVRLMRSWARAGDSLAESGRGRGHRRTQQMREYLVAVDRSDTGFAAACSSGWASWSRSAAAASRPRRWPVVASSALRPFQSRLWGPGRCCASSECSVTGCRSGHGHRADARPQRGWGCCSCCSATSPVKSSAVARCSTPATPASMRSSSPSCWLEPSSTFVLGWLANRRTAARARAVRRGLRRDQRAHLLRRPWPVGWEDCRAL